jgi:hypothetical protein
MRQDDYNAADEFPFYYVGGGYFRQKGVPRGKKAESLHGQEAIDYLLARIVELKNVIRDKEGLPPLK